MLLKISDPQTQQLCLFTGYCVAVLKIRILPAIVFTLVQANPTHHRMNALIRLHTMHHIILWEDKPRGNLLEMSNATPADISLNKTLDTIVQSISAKFSD